MKRLWLMVSALAALLALRALGSQDRPKTPPDEWRIDIGQGEGKATRLAIGDFDPASAEVREIASELTAVLRDDLEFASIFVLADGPEGAEGADVLIAGRIAALGETLLAEVRFRDLIAKREAFATEYRAPSGEARRLAHRIADDVLAKAGVLGVAQTQIAFSSRRGLEPRKTIGRMDYDGAR